jgi:hypothetical protein
MKTLKDQDEVEEVELVESSKEEELMEEDRVGVITMMNRVTWL